MRKGKFTISEDEIERWVATRLRAQNTPPSDSAVKVERSEASNTLTAANRIKGWARHMPASGLWQ